MESVDIRISRLIKYILELEDSKQIEEIAIVCVKRNAKSKPYVLCTWELREGTKALRLLGGMEVIKHRLLDEIKDGN